MSVATYIALAIAPQMFLRLATAKLSMALLGLTGFFCGPIFPSGVLLLVTKLPVRLHVSSVASAAAMGQIGGALAPLAIGLIADRFGIGHLLDVVAPLSVAMLVTWLIFLKTT
jgi:fucose permease